MTTAVSGGSDHGPAGTDAKSIIQRRHDLRAVGSASPAASGQPCAVGSREIDRRADRVVAGLDAGRAGQTRVLPIAVEQVEQRERQSLSCSASICAATAHASSAVLALRQPRAEIAKRDDAAFADDLLGDLVNRGEHAADAPSARSRREPDCRQS